jgi:hypothetical protein
MQQFESASMASQWPAEQQWKAQLSAADGITHHCLDGKEDYLPNSPEVTTIIPLNETKEQNISPAGM